MLVGLGVGVEVIVGVSVMVGVWVEVGVGEGVSVAAEAGASWQLHRTADNRMMDKHAWIGRGMVASCEDYTASQGVIQSRRGAPGKSSSKNHPPAWV